MGPKVFPHNLSQDIMFQTLSQSDKEIQSYQSANKGYQNKVLIEARVNVL